MRRLGRRRSSNNALQFTHGAPAPLPEGLNFEAKEGMLMTRSTKRSRTTSAIRSAVSSSSAWKPRWFILSNDSLRWFTHKQNGAEPEHRGHVFLASATLNANPDPRELKSLSAPKHAPLLCVKLSSPTLQQPLYVYAADLAEKGQWVSAIESNIYLANNPRGGVYAATGFGEARSRTDSGGEARAVSAAPEARTRIAASCISGGSPSSSDISAGGSPPPNAAPAAGTRLSSVTGPQRRAAQAAAEEEEEGDEAEANLDFSAILASAAPAVGRLDLAPGKSHGASAAAKSSDAHWPSGRRRAATTAADDAMDAALRNRLLGQRAPAEAAASTAQLPPAEAAAEAAAEEAAEAEDIVDVDFSDIYACAPPVGRLDLASPARPAKKSSGRQRAATMAAANAASGVSHVGGGRDPSLPTVTRWGAKKGKFPPPPPKAASDGDAISRERAATTGGSMLRRMSRGRSSAGDAAAAASSADGGASNGGGDGGRAKRGMSVHAFAPWSTGWIEGRRNSLRRSSTGGGAAEAAAAAARAGGGSAGGKSRRPPAHRSLPDSERSADSGRSGGEEESSSDDEIQGTAEATTSWVQRRGANMRARAATMGSLLGRRSSVRLDSAAANGAAANGAAAAADAYASSGAATPYGAAGPPGQVVKATNVAGRSGRQRAATMAAIDAASALGATSFTSSCNIVRDRAQQFEQPVPPPAPVPVAQHAASTDRVPSASAPSGSATTRSARAASMGSSIMDSGLGPRMCSTTL